MADIELVIKIPEWKYKSICEGVEASKRCGVVGIDPDIHEAIYNGTPLPKGHGDLIDRKALGIAPIDSTDLPLDRCLMVYLAEDVDEAPTIIEADK